MKKRMSMLLTAAMLAGTLSVGTAAEVQADDVSLRFLDVSPSETRQSYFEGIFAKFYEETGIEDRKSVV